MIRLGVVESSTLGEHGHTNLIRFCGGKCAEVLDNPQKVVLPRVKLGVGCGSVPIHNFSPFDSREEVERQIRRAADEQALKQSPVNVNLGRC